MSSLIEKEGKHYIKGKVVMLATDRDSPIALEEAGRLKFIGVMNNGYLKTSTQQPQYLYIISDDEIKDGDWFMSAFFSYPIHNIESLRNRPGGLGWTTEELNKDFKGHKIIATTDPSLKIDYDNTTLISKYWSGKQLPQPSESFIKAYIEAYNNGNVIEDVLVEWDFRFIEELGVSDPFANQLKLKDNNIIIRKVKDSWTREEVEQLLSDLGADLYHKRIGNGLASIEKWIEENL
jgi:hypothetical protein